MIKTKNEHTGFRNKKMFCYNCGGSFAMPLMPVAVTEMVETMKKFNVLHKNCKPVWKMPEPDMATSIGERAQWWAINGEHGNSSETIWNIFALGSDFKFNYESIKEVVLPLPKYSHPCDPDDFRRCYLLLKAIPEWKLEFHKLRALSSVWEKLVDNWDTLETLLLEQMETEKTNSMYEIMQSYGC